MNIVFYMHVGHCRPKNFTITKLPSAFVVHAATSSLAVQSVSSRQSLVSCRSLHLLEHSARRRAVCTVSLSLPSDVS